jgi:hypothetical protein
VGSLGEIAQGYKRIAFCNDPEGTSWTRYVTELSEVADGLVH